MSTPRTKRQFAGSSADPAQRQITSFFPSRAAGDEAAPSEAQTSRQPLLPSSVQANLLTVGMRIRKSVPEGYKTCGPSAFKLWTDNTPPPQRASALRASSRELVPFCGINKVGGLDPQPALARDDDDDDDEVPDLDAVPELTLSQESVESNMSESSRKRVYDDNDRDDEPTMLTQPSKGWDEEVSPRSFAPSEWRTSRVMAVPRSRVRKSAVPFKGIDQENMAVDGDFEDADFLVLGEAREMDMS
ncbi:hypothetical protein C2857_005196 [Epichloe festucae Fl1]|uniref:Uncharacterized protein n=1 Tax=Epichloe festucae (strain Fl1) TaxID=877507 RepID=A0A7S9KPD7_EPIFF|nr:hypothetical protein C2857_005196 [Epichloe festucae Fl1]